MVDGPRGAGGGPAERGKAASRARRNALVFPRSSHWNRPVDRLPVHPRSDAIVGAVGRAETAHADFGSGLYEGRPIGIPYRVVRRGSETGARELRIRLGVRSRPLPDPAGRPDRGRPRQRRRPPRDPGRPLALPAVRAVLRLPARRRAALARRLGRDLEPAIQPHAPARLDLGRRRGAADPARPGALRRGEEGPDRSRAADHRPAHAAGLRLPRAPLRLRFHEPGPPRHGPAGAPAARLRRVALPAPVARGAAGAQALRRRSWPTTAPPGTCRAPRTRAGTTTTCTRSAASGAATSRWSTPAGCRARGAEPRRASTVDSGAMQEVTVSAVISAPREELFDFVADLSNRPSYADHYLKDFRLARANPVGNGAAARFLLDAPVFSERGEFTIVEAARRGGSSRRAGWAGWAARGWSPSTTSARRQAAPRAWSSPPTASRRP